MSPQWIAQHFQEWEVLASEKEEQVKEEGIITEQTDPTTLQWAMDFIAKENSAHVRREAMPHEGFWTSLERQLANDSKESRLEL